RTAIDPAALPRSRRPARPGVVGGAICPVLHIGKSGHPRAAIMPCGTSYSQLPDVTETPVAVPRTDRQNPRKSQGNRGLEPASPRPGDAAFLRCRKQAAKPPLMSLTGGKITVPQPYSRATILFGSRW